MLPGIPQWGPVVRGTRWSERLFMARCLMETWKEEPPTWSLSFLWFTCRLPYYFLRCLIIRFDD